MDDKLHFKNFEENQKKMIKLLQEILSELKENNKYNVPKIQSITKLQMQIGLLYTTIKGVIGSFNIFNIEDKLKELQGGKQ